MLNDFIIVESAVSAFNNAALWMPAFLWWTILALPLFVVVYWCADTIVSRVGWDGHDVLNRASVWVAGLTCAWVVMFSGNYGVLRDGLSVLPMMVATIVFLTSLFVSSHLRDRPLPHMGWRRWLLVIVIVIGIGMSDTHAWWGPLLQLGAFFLGVLLGRIARGDMRTVGGLTLIMMMVDYF